MKRNFTSGRSAKKAKRFFQDVALLGHGAGAAAAAGDLLGLGCEPAGAGKGGLGFAPQLRPPALKQAACDAEIVGDLVHTAPRFTRATASFLNCGVNVRRIRGGFLGHGTLLLESTY